jgi:hypothetical protein
MSTHPNIILMAEFVPDDLSRKTMKNILKDSNADKHGFFRVGESEYSGLVMEDEYEEEYQISSSPGNLIFHAFVTYGYGEKISWEKLTLEKEVLDKWAKEMAEKHHASYKIFVGANYW